MDAQIERTAVFMGRRCFCTLNKFTALSEEHIPEGKFQWFVYIVAYLQFYLGETNRPRKSQLDEMHTATVRKTKEKSIVISSFKMDIHPILGRLSEVKYYTPLLTAIITPELQNARDRFI